MFPIVGGKVKAVNKIVHAEISALRDKKEGFFVERSRVNEPITIILTVPATALILLIIHTTVRLDLSLKPLRMDFPPWMMSTINSRLSATMWLPLLMPTTIYQYRWTSYWKYFGCSSPLTLPSFLLSPSGPPPVATTQKSEAALQPPLPPGTQYSGYRQDI